MAQTNTNTSGSTQAGRKGGDSGTGTPDSAYDLISVIYHALQGAQTYEQYARDAEQSGQQELAQFFRDAQQENRRCADRGRQLLGRALQQGGGNQRMSQ